MNKTSRFFITCEKEDYEKLKTSLSTQGMTVNGWVRNKIKEMVDDYYVPEYEISAQTVSTFDFAKYMVSIHRYFQQMGYKLHLNLEPMEVKK